MIEWPCRKVTRINVDLEISPGHDTAAVRMGRHVYSCMVVKILQFMSHSVLTDLNARDERKS